MKKIICICSLFLSLFVEAQITIDLGKDTTYCVSVIRNENFSPFKNIIIGGDTNNTKIKWTVTTKNRNGKIENITNYLNNSTILNTNFNPILSIRNKWIKFKLIIEKNEFKVEDSIHIRISELYYLSSIPFYNLSLGDSIEINASAYGGIEPLIFLGWSPSTYVENPLLENTKFIPFYSQLNDSIILKQIYIDSVGCKLENEVIKIGITTSNVESKNDDLQLNVKIIKNKLCFENKSLSTILVNLFDIYGNSLSELQFNEPYKEFLIERTNQVVLVKVINTVNNSIQIFKIITQ